MIASILLPYFIAAIECRTDPTLTGRPLIVAAPPANVFAVSGEAARLGVEAGMSLRQARLRCPQAHLIPARPDDYQQTLGEILELVGDFTARFEPEQHPNHVHIYADFELMTGPVQLALAKEIGQAIHNQSRLNPALGLASGKFPAGLAAGSIGLSRTLLVTPGQERSFLAPFPIGRLPVDKELQRRFALLGLKTMGQLAALPGKAVLTQFGGQGRWLHRLARGLDDRPLQPYTPTPPAQATHHFDGAINDRSIVMAAGRSLLQSLSSRLQANGQAARRLQVRLHLENGPAWTRQITLRQPSGDPARLARVLEVSLEQAQVQGGITAVEITLAGLAPAPGRQLPLFGEPPPVAQARWLPELVTRHGPDRFFQVELTAPDAPLPERRFRLRDVGE